MLKFLHLSDSHLGESIPLYHASINNWRGEGFIKNYNAALRYALRGEVDFVLHSGDLFDRRHINLDIITRAMVPLRKIAARNIPIFIVPGNHEKDYIPGGLLLAGKNVYIFNKPKTIEFSIRNQKIVIAGFPYIKQEAGQQFTKILKQTGWKYKEGCLNILLCHQIFEGAKVGVKNFTFRNGENVIKIEDIPFGFDYVASGHIHKHQVLKTKKTTICYAGSTQRVSFQEMDEEKGYYIVSLKGETAHPKFYKLPVTPMVAISFDTTNKSAKEFISFLEEKIGNAEPHSILRFHLKGQIELKKLREIPLYLYKRKRDDIRVEFRRENLVILKKRTYSFHPPHLHQTNDKPEDTINIPLNSGKTMLPFRKKEISKVPLSPGVYELLNKNNRVLYVDRSKILKNRLLAHLRKKENKNEGFYFWLQQVDKVNIIPTAEELSAMFIEINLIRNFLPPYNKQIKEFQNYVYLVIRKDINFPTIDVVSEVKNDGNTYFGPFRKEHKIRENVKILREVFGIRPCRRNLNDNLRLFSCVLEEMGKCDAPCTGGVSPSEYRKRIDRLTDFLYGYDRSVLDRLTEEKKKLARIQEFEQAAVVQKNVTNLTLLFNTLKKIRTANELKGSLTLKISENNYQHFKIINGRIIWNRAQNQNKKFPFPPKKWELDEMLLLMNAVLNNEQCVSIDKDGDIPYFQKGLTEIGYKGATVLKKP